MNHETKMKEGWEDEGTLVLDIYERIDRGKFKTRILEVIDRGPEAVTSWTSGNNEVTYKIPWLPRKDEKTGRNVAPCYNRIDWNPDEPYFTYPLLYTAIVRSALHKSNYRFVEIGAWKGHSSSFMGINIIHHLLELSYQESNIPIIQLDAVDTFEGSEEHKDIIKEGNFDLYESCKQQLDKTFCSDFVNLVKGDSVKVSENYPDESLDFVFVDGDHSYDGVTRDIKAYWPKLKVGAVMAGHDYEGGWIECKRAVDDFFGRPTTFNLGVGGMDGDEDAGELYWAIGELCWGVVKTGENSWIPLASHTLQYLIRSLENESLVGFTSPLPNDALLGLYNLENF